MNKCSTCGKKIQNIYKLDNKIYGYNCYRLALAQKRKNLKEQYNLEYSIQCLATIQVFRNKTFTKDWTKNFQLSIVKQWDECQKLTAKQLNVIKSKLTDTERFEILLIRFELTDNKKTMKDLCLYHKSEEVIDIFKHDERLHNIIKFRYGNVKYIVSYEYIDLEGIEETEKHTDILSNRQLNRLHEEKKDLKNDKHERLNILEVIKID